MYNTYKSTSFTDSGRIHPSPKDSPNPEGLTSKNYTLKIIYDDSPENPATEWDCIAPLAYTSGRYDEYTEHSAHPIRSELLDLITDRQLSLNKKILLNIIEVSDDYIKENKYEKQTFADALRDEITHANDSLDLLEELAKISKTPYLRKASRGYSQGDYADVILVATPTFIKSTGVQKKHIAQALESDHATMSAYFWGDIYGFQLIEHVPLYTQDGTLSDTTEDDIIDSCWGFYGDDGLKSIREHLPDFALSAFDSL